MSELVVTSQGQLERNAKAFDCHDRHGANNRAYRDVDQRDFGAIQRSDVVDHE